MTSATTTPRDQLDAQVDPLLDDASLQVRTAVADAVDALQNLVDVVTAAHEAATTLDQQYAPHLTGPPDPRSVVPTRLDHFTSHGRGTTFHAASEALAAAIAGVGRSHDVAGPATGFNDGVLRKRAASFSTRYGIEAQA
ncbi:MAG: hypothetical protein PIR53_02690 [Nocardioides alkalitolerans]